MDGITFIFFLGCIFLGILSAGAFMELSDLRASVRRNSPNLETANRILDYEYEDQG